MRGRNGIAVIDGHVQDGTREKEKVKDEVTQHLSPDSALRVSKCRGYVTFCSVNGRTNAGTVSDVLSDQLKAEM